MRINNAGHYDGVIAALEARGVHAHHALGPARGTGAA